MTLDLLPRSNLCAVLAHAARMYPDQTAVVDGARSTTYAALWEQVRRAAAELTEIGVRPGDRVVSSSPNCAELLVLYFAIAHVGAVSIPLNPMLKPPEVQSLLDRLEPRLLFGKDAAMSALETVDVGGTVLELDATRGSWSAGTEERASSPAAAWVDAKVATILFTSGSTMDPKGCVKTHLNMLASAINLHLSWPRTPADRELYAIPLAGIGFANLILGPMLGGATIVLEKFSPTTTLDAMERCGVTSTFLPATMLDSLLREEASSGRRDLSSMRLCHASYAMSERLRVAIAERFPNAVHYSYGLTEGGMSSASADQFLADPTCVGKPNGLTRFGAVDDKGAPLPPGEIGQIVVAGPDVMAGYYADEAGTSTALRNGWLHTGDHGYLDPNGALHFTGRMKDVIKTGGSTVSAAEVEQVLTSHEAVRDAAVIGVPDDHWGEAVHAYVELEPAGDVTVEALREFLTGHLASFKVPKSVIVLPTLPRNPSGKVAKGELLTRAGAPWNR